MGEFDVKQRTDNYMFNATSLLEQWNKSNPNDQRRLDKFWDSTHLPELMEEIVKNEYPTYVNSTDVKEISTYPKIGDVEPNRKGRKKADSNTPKLGELKKILCKSKTGRYDSGTWMHPMLFIKFAMYLNPRFEYQVLKFVQDNLIELRHEAGDQCNEMKKAVSRLVSDSTTQYSELMRAINIVVFGHHATDLRQSAQPEELKELAEIENLIRSSVDLGLITRWDQLIEMLRKKYRQKYSYAA